MASKIVWSALALSALALLALGEWTDIDMRLALASFDPASRAFPLRHAWLTETVGHGMVHDLMALAGLGVVSACIVDARASLFSPWMRHRMRLLALCAVAVPLCVALAKQGSSLACPWDLHRFGGSQPYYGLLDNIPLGTQAGHCWPGGHASSVLWLIGLVFFWLPHDPRRALAAGALVLLAGLAVGWIQQMRGAHFLSHTLWSMWFACAITAVVWRWAFRPEAEAGEAAAGRRAA